MKILLIAIGLLLTTFVGHVYAQLSNVTTTGLTTGQCVYANGTSMITSLGCSGRNNVLAISGATTLTDSECGYVILAGATAYYEVSLPATPLPNCEFTFEPGTQGFYINFNGQSALLPGYNGDVTMWTIPDEATFRTNNESFSLIFTDSVSYARWEQSAFSSSIYQTTVQPHNAQQLAHGQVYFQWNGSTSQFQLCERNGPGGLIVDGQMQQVPIGCLTLGQSETISSKLNYLYAAHTNGDVLSVDSVADDPSGKILIGFTTSVLGGVGDEVAISCFSIGGAIQANVSDTGTIKNTSGIELMNTSSVGLGTYTSGGTCDIVRLAASMVSHTTGADGVEQMSGDGHYSLVGMCQIGANNSVSDTSTQRDCASWYNRGLKTCVNNFSSDQMTTSTSYTELSSQIECNFVTWGMGDPTSRSDLSWSISGMISNDAGMDGGAVTAGFDGALPTAPIEETAGVNPSTSVSGFPFSVGGSASGLAEGPHVITLFGKAINGGTAKVYGSVPKTSLEIQIPQ